MRELKVLGPGCRNCELLARRVEEAALALKLEYRIEKVTDYDQMMRFPIVGTPALVVDGVVRFSGSVPTVATLRNILSD
ncbi:MAG TPA: thioredoxin family protein [Vicinamibacterales bacterium]|nr:thioredoxin family protein [Vicinamibacterales bacterium]